MAKEYKFVKLDFSAIQLLPLLLDYIRKLQYLALTELPSI